MAPLIVAFAPGTSGRFISAISHMLQNNYNDEFHWPDNNSAHNYKHVFTRPYWSDTPYKLQTDRDIAIFNNSKQIYNYILLKSNQIMPTHAYPKFELIKERVNDCKIIIIGHNKDNLKEILINNNKKNLHNVSQELFFKQYIEYVNLEIPDNFKQQTLVIMYDEIYKEHNNSYIALDKISQFLNVNVNDNIMKNYKRYVDGRSRILAQIDTN